MQSDIFIACARRSPIGKLNGAFRGLAAAQIGGQVIKSLVTDSGLDPAAISEVIMGQVLTGGAGQNPARQSTLQGGLPISTPALTINQVCGGGQRSIHLAVQAIKCGDAEIVVAGGQDSMTEAPHLIFGAREGIRMGDGSVKDSMLIDGLIDAFHHVHMGVTVEKLAQRYRITRDEQDTFALASQSKTKSAIAARRFDNEVVAISVDGKKQVSIVTHDEHPMPSASLESLGRLKPVFDVAGSITAGNSSGLNDGAASVIVCDKASLARHGLQPMARIVSFASAAVEPMDMGLGPVAASRKVLTRAGWKASELDLMEINEAFAAQAIAVNREMNWDTAKINVNGGAIALGHPLAGSGCRIVVTLLHEMVRRDAKKGLASLCIGGGQGVAICFER